MKDLEIDWNAIQASISDQMTRQLMVPSHILNGAPKTCDRMRRRSFVKAYYGIAGDYSGYQSSLAIERDAFHKRATSRLEDDMRDAARALRERAPASPSPARDSSGERYNPEVHSKSKCYNSDGTWRKKKTKRQHFMPCVGQDYFRVSKNGDINKHTRYARGGYDHWEDYNNCYSTELVARNARTQIAATASAKTVALSVGYKIPPGGVRENEDGTKTITAVKLECCSVEPVIEADKSRDAWRTAQMIKRDGEPEKESLPEPEPEAVSLFTDYNPHTGTVARYWSK